MVLLMLVAVSGTGKSSIARRLLERHPRLKLSVSHTTRQKRHGEMDGRDYHFVSRGQFESERAAGGFAEWAEYVGNLYGTARSTIEAARVENHDLLFDIEVQGANQLKSVYPDAVSVFVLPPSWSRLKARLVGRGTETDASIARRLARGRSELRYARGFDYLVVNDDIDQVVRQIGDIYAGTFEGADSAGATLTQLLNDEEFLAGA
ncbi:MAG: guanylate kinase [Myxococcota bacterium]|nr:guanylate kinase [Myxococcota bacterium]